MRDVSDWVAVGYGVDSTLEKYDLLSPETFLGEQEGHRRYIIKYARNFAEGVSWEDSTELIASNIGKLLNLKMMDVEIVVRNSRRGALLKNFVPYRGQFLEGGVLLSDIEDYQKLSNTDLRGKELIKFGFSIIEKLDFWESIKMNFVEMNFFDILIGNQDRHSYNWMMLYYEDGKKIFSPIYDNGASLGFRFDDGQLEEYMQSETKIPKYIRNAKLKVGIFENKRVKAKELVDFLRDNFSNECEQIIRKIEVFDFEKYHKFINRQTILSEKQKEWLKLIISHRREYILKWYREED